MGADVIERSGVFVAGQWKAQTTHDTAVTPDTMFRGLKLTLSPKITTQEIDPGGVFPVGYALGKEWTEIKAEGIPSYQEMDFILASLLCVPSGNVYLPKNDTENAYTSYTIQVGGGTVCEKVANATVVGMTLKYTPEEVSIDADLIGFKTEAGAWVSGITPPTNTPILPGQCTVEVSGTSTVGTRVLSAELALTGRWKPLWVIPATPGTSTAHINMVEGKPDGSIKVMVEADAAGLAYLTRLRATNATTRFAFKASVGSLSLVLECATQIKDIDAFEISDTTYNIGYTLGLVHDGTLGYGCKATLVKA